jgi:hypothetical protein
MKFGPLTIGRAVDSLEEGRGAMRVKLLGLLNVVDAVGPELDQGSALRWLNETMFFPAVWATGLIKWEPIDATSAVGAVTAGDLEVQAEFRFDEEGRFVDFYADRYRTVGDEFVATPWSTPISAHAPLAGVVVPTAGSGVWHLDDDEAFDYIQLEVKAPKYHG